MPMQTKKKLKPNNVNNANINNSNTDYKSTMTNLVFGTAKQLIKPKNYTPSAIKTQLSRSKRVAYALVSLAKVSKTAYEIDQKSNVTNQEIIAAIQKFCLEFCQSIRLDVVAIKPIPQDHALWTSNHISWLDIPVVGSIIPTFFLSKAEIAQWPLIGWLARTGNTLFIQRGSGDTGSVGEQMAKFLQAGSPVVFFPEATTTNGRSIKKIHGKLLQSAIDTKVNIQPIVIAYVNDKGKLDDSIPYFGDMSFLQSIKRVLDNHPAKAYVLPLDPISPIGKSRDELTYALQQAMTDGLAKLHKQVLIQD
ncbi:lyso-ornithine lipid acyltransferase [Moraxella macacae 0408225]|uniref:Lyso-ornithine lipid acyltransferase n=1 Tax=Moraxella macacae 0408225 TaxID=1230338 RepID=L2F6N9_9GAMM|nr:lysophospholipid acyltransferase family protein [Moraxella macacae]ELA08098.1 lyso-ornithine lipid acyltransferase [Moraxella macacae 0408225]